MCYCIKTPQVSVGCHSSTIVREKYLTGHGQIIEWIALMVSLHSSYYYATQITEQHH